MSTVITARMKIDGSDNADIRKNSAFCDYLTQTMKTAKVIPHTNAMVGTNPIPTSK